MNVCEHLTIPARLFPERVAIRFEGQSLSYQRLDQLSIAATEHLAAAGVEQGDRVAIMLPNIPAFAVWYYAALRFGAIVVSISTRLVPDEVLYLLDDCDCRTLVTNDEIKLSLDEALSQRQNKMLVASRMGDCCDGTELTVDSTAMSRWVDTSPDDPALVLYTSGTTGFAKGATLSHQNVRATVHAFNHLCHMQLHDRILLAVPLFHCYGQNALLNSGLNVGATLILQDGFDLQESRRLISEESITQLYCVPTTFRLLEEYCAPGDLESVNYCFSAAATLPIQVSQRWQEKFGMPIHEGYGLTETSPFASYNHQLKYVPGSIGMPVDLVEMKIVDPETGSPCPPGKLGEIIIRGPNVMLGYWNRPEATQEAIRDGWFHSGDIGRIDEDGYFYIVDRVKDMISVGGIKVFPAEVERVLLDHESVAEVAVVGVPDDILGETVAALIVKTTADSTIQASSDDVQAESITRFAREHLADYKVPQRVCFLEELPRNPAGKVLKTVLRKRLVDEAVEAPARETSQTSGSHNVSTESTTLASPLANRLAGLHSSARLAAVSEYLQTEVQQILGQNELPDTESRFIETGMDSLMIVELHERLQKQVGDQIELPVTLMFDYPRIIDLAGFLDQSLTTKSADDQSDQVPYESNQPITTTESQASLQTQVESLSEKEALDELKKELGY